jgi:hypothetical protein
MSSLHQYTALERAMMVLDECQQSELADTLRDVMDKLWYEHLTSDERAQLNSRGHVEAPTPVEEVQAPLADTVAQACYRKETLANEKITQTVSESSTTASDFKESLAA